jgi:FdhD protein
MTGAEPRTITRLREGERAEVEDMIAREYLFTLAVNGQQLVTLSCTPASLREFTVGFLAAEGIINDVAEITYLEVDEQQGLGRVEVDRPDLSLEDLALTATLTSGCGRGLTFRQHQSFLELEPLNSSLTLPADRIHPLVRDLEQQSALFQSTGAVHSAALCTAEEVVVVQEDIGRHSALDKLFGAALLRGIPLSDKVVISSGRITAEMITKVARQRIPIAISRCAPSDLAIKYAEGLELTLVGFVRGRRMNLYTRADRIV